jgi:stage II sporulation protein D
MKSLLLLIPLIVVACVLLTPSGCTPRNEVGAQLAPPHVRVRLLAGVDKVNLKMDQPPTIVVDGGRTRRKLGVTPGQTVSLALADTGWTINGTNAGAGVLEILPAEDGSVSINGSPYRGVYRCVPVAGGKFDVVNDLDVESYLMGVLPKELFSDWQLEAYMAQAVIARTYALYEVKTGPQGRHWDLYPDERSQVYGGMGAETAKSKTAVERTRGKVVAYGPPGGERIFKAYFSSCCGGVSANVNDAMGDPAIPPLEARYNGNTCSISTRYNWGPVTISKAELTRRARLWAQQNYPSLANVPGIANIEISATNAFGRPRRYLLTDANGQQYTLGAEHLRKMINFDANGVSTVYSSFFRPVDAGDNMQFVEGHGNGHGTGACQWCMQARALAGDGYEQIVLRSFPQTLVLRAY